MSGGHGVEGGEAADARRLARRLRREQAARAEAETIAERALSEL